MEPEPEQLQLVAVARERSEVTRIGRRSGHHELGAGLVVGAQQIERGDHTFRASTGGERADPDQRRHSASRITLSWRCSVAS